MPYAFDPELEPIAGPAIAMRDAAPPVAVHDIPTRRANFAMLLAALQAQMPNLPGVEKKTFATKAPDGHELQLYWFTPAAAAAASNPTSALLHIHGGGMILGSVADFALMLNNIVAATGVPILSVEYRIAPEKPHPTLLEDCYVGLTYLRDHAAELHVDPARIGIMGESAGGGLAAGLALMARDRHFTPAVKKQILVYPMLDDRTTVANAELAPFLLWTYDDNITGWSAYLGKDVVGTDKVSAYAAPAREKDLAGLPPAYIDVGELDIFMAEDLEYAKRLASAGVSTEFHLHAGCPHAFEGLAPESAVAKRAIGDRMRAIKSF